MLRMLNPRTAREHTNSIVVSGMVSSHGESPVAKMLFWVLLCHNLGKILASGIILSIILTRK